VVPISAGSATYTGSGTAYYSYTSTTYSPVIATANFNGELFVDSEWLAVPQCAAYSCTSSSKTPKLRLFFDRYFLGGCSVNTLCGGDNSGDTYYFTVESTGAFSFNVMSPGKF
jgi:hypothetical protein